MTKELRELSSRVMSIQPSQTLAISAEAKQMREDGYDVIGFAAGEPDFNTPKNIRDAAIRAIKMGFTKYTPAAGTYELREAVAKSLKDRHDLDYRPEQIVVSNGAKHALFNTFQTLLNPGDEVIVFRPYWLSYPELIRLAGGEPVFVDVREENNFEPQPEDIERAVTEKTKAVIVNNPSNPCGTIFSEKTIQTIAGIAEAHNLFIVSDEIYGDLVYDGKRHDSIAHISHDVYDHTIVINGLSKSYAMTGWRIGYSACIPPIAKRISSLQSHETSNPNSIAQYAALEALTGPQDAVYMMRDEFDRRRQEMVRLIDEIPEIHCARPEGAFYVMMNIQSFKGMHFEGHTIETSLDFTKLLLEKAMVAAVPGSAFGADDFIRLSYATSMDNIKRGLSRIRRFCKAVLAQNDHSE